MQRTKIEWVKNDDGTQGYTINPVKGLCPMACPYCYARRIYKRFKLDETIRWEPEHLIDLESIPKGSRVFIGSTMELFGDWVKEKWLQDLFYCWIPRYPQHTFIFLTKQPENLIKWSPFPDNCWVGVSCTTFEQYGIAGIYLPDVNAKVKIISFEPLLEQITDKNNQYNSEMMAEDLKFTGINWLIIGQQTPENRKTQPKKEWIREIVEAADNAGIPVFLKDNLLPLLKNHNAYPWAFTPNSVPTFPTYRQEFPKEAASEDN